MPSEAYHLAFHSEHRTVYERTEEVNPRENRRRLIKHSLLY